MKNLIQSVSFRAGFYQLLSTLLLKEVSLDLLRGLSSLKGAPFSVGTENMEGLIPAEGEDLDEIKEKLDVDFARVFLGLGPDHAFPYESIYRSRSGLLMQGPFDEVRDAYRIAGINKNPELKEPDDHIAFELAFMAHLCNLTETAVRNHNKEEALIQFERQKEFLRNRLISWVPSFCAHIERAAQTEFYKSLAALVRSWILFEQEQIDNLIGDLKSES